MTATEEAGVGLVEITDALKSNYLTYAKYVIQNRAIPDVRDGLKVGQRRVLWTMWEMGCRPGTPTRKSARIVGSCIGKYHPHGDMAVYDAMARMAQDFTMSHPLVDGKGNFGSIDGHPPAAQRYTEARLSAFGAHVLFSDIGDETVDFADNYDGLEKEPVILPSRLPLILLTAPTGIAVAMATNVPPHNLQEVCKAVISTVKRERRLNGKELTNLLPGPDFPLGGLVKQSNYTGSKISLQYRVTSDFESEGNSRAIIIRSLPYLMDKPKFITSIAEAAQAGKVDGISEVRDESSGQEVRICIELKRDIDHKVVLSQLYKSTYLSSSFAVNIVAIHGLKPYTFDIPEILESFVTFRREVIRRRTDSRLRKSEYRKKLVDAIIKACASVQKTINIIRKSDEPVEELKKEYDFDQEQAEYVFEMPLRRLSKTDGTKLEEEIKQLVKTIGACNDILACKERVDDIIIQETQEIADKYGSERRTLVVPDFNEVTIKDTVKQQDVVLTFLSDGTVKSTPLSDYRVQRRRGTGISGVNAPDEVYPVFVAQVSSHDEIMLLTDKGNRYRTRAYDIPALNRGRRPKPVSEYVSGFEEGEKVVACTPMKLADDECLCILGSKGLLKKTAADTVRKSRDSTKVLYDCERGGSVVGAVVAKATDEVFLGTRLGKGLRISLADIREVQSRSAAGVAAIKVANGDALLGITHLVPGELFVLTVSKHGYGKRTAITEYNTKGRGGQGMATCKLVDGDELVFSGVVSVVDESSLFLMTNTTQCIRLPFTQVPVNGRAVRGVMLKKLDKDEKLVVASVE